MFIRHALQIKEIVTTGALRRNTLHEQDPGHQERLQV